MEQTKLIIIQLISNLKIKALKEGIWKVHLIKRNLKKWKNILLVKSSIGMKNIFMIKRIVKIKLANLYQTNKLRGVVILSVGAGSTCY